MFKTRGSSPDSNLDKLAMHVCMKSGGVSCCLQSSKPVKVRSQLICLKGDLQGGSDEKVL